MKHQPGTAGQGRRIRELLDHDASAAEPDRPLRTCKESQFLGAREGVFFRKEREKGTAQPAAGAGQRDTERSVSDSLAKSGIEPAHDDAGLKIRDRVP